MLESAFELIRRALRAPFRSSSDEPNEVKPIYHSAPLKTDAQAVGNEPGTAAFLAPPAGSSVYYGFRILDDVEVDGFKFGMIDDFESHPEVVGDAFIVAPDDSRAGLNWRVSDADFFSEVLPMDARRWGVYEVPFPYPMTSRENARRNLAAVLPKLRDRWEIWREKYGVTGSKA